MQFPLRYKHSKIIGTVDITDEKVINLINKKFNAEGFVLEGFSLVPTMTAERMLLSPDYKRK